MTTHERLGALRRVIAAATIAWFLVVLLAVLSGAVRFAIAGALAPPLLLGLVAAPIVVFAAGYRGSARFRDFVASLDLAFLVRLHMLRVVGLVFVLLYLLGHLPAGFALPAGLGDLAIALSAPLVARSLASPGPRTSTAFVAWNALGLVDFAAALALGVAHSDAPVGFLAADVTTVLVTEFPLALIPAFGVPFFIIVHLIALIRWRETTGRASSSPLGARAA